MKKAIKYIIMALVAVIFVGTFVFLVKKSKPKEIEYQQLDAVIKDIRRSTVVTGKIQPRNEVNIKPQINGIITEIYKEAGQQVSEGEVIAKLKVIPEMSSLSAAESRVRLAELNLNQAKTNLDRVQSLYDKKLVSADEYDKLAQLYKQAKEERSAAQDALEVIRDGVSSTNAKGSSTLIRSTISGLILDIPVKVGNSVIQANTMNDGTTVATVANMNDLIFEGKIDETEVGSLVEGMQMIISIGALPAYRSNAILEYVSPKAVENNGANQFTIKAAVEVKDEFTIRSGYSANAEIVLSQALNAVTVPESALEFSGDSIFVYKHTGDNNYERTLITTGLSDGINIEVKSGVAEGEKIRGTQILNSK